MQKLAEICVRRPVFATMLIMALVVLGLASYRSLGVDLFPKIEFPTVTITTTLRGAAPEEVETQVSKRIEEAVNTISGIDELRSISSEGLSQVIIQFLLEKDPDIAAEEIRDKVSAVMRDLPRDVDPPVIQKIATDAAPVINVVVASGRDLRETTKIVDDRIKKNIESLPGVGQVRFVGERNRQIQVWLNGERLYAYNLNIDQVRTAVATQNVEIPGGRVDQGKRELSLRTLGRVERPEDFGRIVVATQNGVPIRLNDIGRVEDGFEEPRSLTRLDGTPAVGLEVRKQSGTNTVDVIHAVKTRIADLQKTLPPDFQITYVRDQSTFIEESFKAVQEHLILGGICAALIVLLFIRSWRSTLIAAVAIPTSIISTYSLIRWMGFTLNQITMLALVLVVGIVIDDAIVVLENIFRNMEEKALPPFQAAIQGTREIGLAVMATTLSLVIIFLPVALMGGIVGRFMSSFGYTAAFAILVSLLVSFTLTPMLSSRFLMKSSDQPGGHTKDTFVFRMFAGPYRRLLHWSLSHRWAIAAFSLLVVLSTVPLFNAIGKDFLPVDDQSEFEITARMPVGSSLEGSDAVLRQLEEDVRRLPGVKHLLTSIGADVQRQVDRGSILVELVPIRERKQTQQQLMLQARRMVQKYRDLVVGVQLPTVIQGATTQDLQFFIQGPDLDRLDRYAQQIKTRLREIPGVTDIDSSYEPGKPEIRVLINRDRAADLNVSVSSIATAMRTLVGGDPQVTTYREGDDRYDVQVRVEKEFRDSPRALERLFVPSPVLGNVSVSNVASLQEATGPLRIERYNRQRQIFIVANLVEGQALSNVLPILNQTVEKLNMPPDYQSGLVGRSKEFGRAATGYVIALFLSLIFMYMVLAAQFESFIDPVTILLSLPLSVPFALVSLVVTHENFSIIYTSLGILMLFGIVKKNAILQIDRIKNLRAHSTPRLEAILHGCEDRLRPILMTTAALVAGMIPMALGTGAGSGSRRTVAIVVIGGQSLCLLLTLLVTPVAYSLFDDLAHAGLWARLGRLVAWPAAALRRAMFLLLAGVVAGGFGLQAQATVEQPRRVGVGMVQRKLSLQEAIEMALKNNLEIEIEKSNTATASEAVRAARGFYDPTLRWLPGIESRATPTGSVLLGTSGKLAEHFHTENFYFRQKLPFAGAGFNIDFENGRQSTSNPFTSLNPYFNSRLVVGITQPLLRNRAVDRERTEIRVRRKQVDISETDFELRVIDVITRVEQVYWDLVAAREDADVKRESVDLGRRSLEQNQRMIQAGTLASVELAASEAELERRLDTWYASLETVTQVENVLKAMLTDSRLADLWNDEIIPTEGKPVEPPQMYDLREIVTQALKQRPEVRSVTLRQESNDLQKRYNLDQTRPQVNLVAAYTNTGLGGAISTNVNPFTASQNDTLNRLNQLSALAGLPPLPPAGVGGPPPPLIGGYGTSLSNLFGGSYQSVQVGLALDLTLRNRTAESNVAQSVIAGRRLKLEQARVEQGIEAQVRNALQGIETARQRIAAAEASAKAAKDKLDSETRLFEAGESTNFLVLTRQNEYADSRRRAVAAHLDLNKAVSRLEQSLGTTLSTHKVTLR